MRRLRGSDDDRRAWYEAHWRAGGPLFRGEHDEGPPTPTPMPRTVAWGPLAPIVLVCPHGRRWGVLCPHCYREIPYSPDANVSDAITVGGKERMP